jgi:hypothetical protein
MPTHVVILGARFGGLELWARLSEELADEVSVTLLALRDCGIPDSTSADRTSGALSNLGQGNC